jgi:hypothetical protein
MTKNIHYRSIKKEDYKELAEQIKSDKLPCSKVAKYFSDKNFSNWYKKRHGKIKTK